MTQHQQWIEVQGDGAAPQTGWRCDGCGQVKWQEQKPAEPCELCPIDGPGGSAFIGAFVAERLNDPKPGGADAPTAALPENVQDELPAKPKRGSRIPGLTKGDDA